MRVRRINFISDLRFIPAFHFRLTRVPAIAGSAFLALFVFSLILFLILGGRQVKRVVFFPSAHNRTLQGEERRIPSRRNLEKEVRLLVEEILLGPAEPDHVPVVPRGVKLQSLVIRGGVLSLSLSKAFLEQDTEIVLTYEQMVHAIVKSIYFSFPRLKKVYILIAGQLPHFKDSPRPEEGFTNKGVS